MKLLRRCLHSHKYLKYRAEKLVNDGHVALQRWRLHCNCLPVLWLFCVIIRHHGLELYSICYRTPCHQKSLIWEQYKVGWASNLSQLCSIQDHVSWDAGSRLWCCVFVASDVFLGYWGFFSQSWFYRHWAFHLASVQMNSFPFYSVDFQFLYYNSLSLCYTIYTRIFISECHFIAIAAILASNWWTAVFSFSSCTSASRFSLVSFLNCAFSLPIYFLSP